MITEPIDSPFLFLSSIVHIMGMGDGGLGWRRQCTCMMKILGIFLGEAYSSRELYRSIRLPFSVQSLSRVFFKRRIKTGSRDSSVFGLASN